MQVQKVKPGFKLVKWHYRKVLEIPESWDVEKITNDTKSMKIKVKAAKNFKEAFETARKSVDERNGLVVITGSSTMISEYWRYKGVKKI